MYIAKERNRSIAQVGTLAKCSAGTLHMLDDGDMLGELDVFHKSSQNSSHHKRRTHNRHDRKRRSDRYGQQPSHRRKDKCHHGDVSASSPGCSVSTGNVGLSIVSPRSTTVSSRTSSGADSESTSLHSRDETVSSGERSSMTGSVSTYSDEEDDDSVASVLSGISVANKDAVPRVKSFEKIEGKPMYNTIMAKLISSATLKPTSIILTDNSNSSQHANHVGSKGWAENGDSHFSLEVVSEAFEGLTLVKRHRMIYTLLGETMQKIHSLDIEAKSTSEV